MSRLLTLLLLLLVPAPLFGQDFEITVDKRIRLEAPKVTEQEDGAVYSWYAPPPLKFEKEANLCYIEGPAGTYRVNLTIITAEVVDGKVKFKEQSSYIDFDIGKQPDKPDPDKPDDPDVPTPPDNPDLPEDTYGFGKAASEWLRSVKPEYLGYAPKLGANLRIYGEKLAKGEVAEIADALKLVADANQAILPAGSEEGAAWKSFNSSFNEKLNSHWPLNKSETYSMLVNMAAVLESVK